MASSVTRFGHARWSEVAVLAGPALLLFFGFVLLPFVMAVGFSFTNVKLLQTDRIEWTGLDNYTRMFGLKLVEAPTAHGAAEPLAPSRQWRALKRAAPAEFDGYQFLTDLSFGGKRYLVGARDPQFLRSIANTFLFALLVVPLQTALAFAMALWVNQTFRGRVVLRTVFFSPVVTSMVVVAAIWGLILHTEAGLANQVLRQLFGANASQPDWLGDPHLAMLSIAIMSAWQGAGFQMLIFLSGLQGISIEQYEAADVMGASRWQKFRYITLPGLKRTLVFVGLSTTIMAFGLFTQVDVLTGGGPMDSTSTLIFHSMRVGFREQDIAYGSAMTLFFFLFVLLLSLGQKKLMERLGQ
ncbi:MAG: carbohydrate ABC transporter permease [Roseateles sp.]|uniref:carbohydrate ABC transporter permease n=1 Tax=Roseateles sp. TaxID=1971397 RepID=UPI004035AB44